MPQKFHDSFREKLEERFLAFVKTRVKKCNLLNVLLMRFIAKPKTSFFLSALFSNPRIKRKLYAHTLHDTADLPKVKIIRK